MSAELDFPPKPLSELAEVTGGVTLGRTVPEAVSVELPYLRVANVQDGFIDTSDLKMVRVLQSEVQRYSVRKGDVLITEGGDFDKVGRGAVWDGRISPCLHQNHLFRVRCNPAKLLPEYLAIYLASDNGRRYFLSIAKQTTNLASINSTQLKRMPVPCPPLEEQRRTVEVLEAFGQQERAIETAIAKARLIREEVARILLAHRNAPIVTIADVAVVGSGSTPSRSRSDYWSGGTVSWVRTAEICFDIINETAERVTAKAVEETGLRVYPPGSVLLAMYGEGVTRGRSAVLGVAATVNQAAAAIVCDPQKIDYRYLRYWLEGHYEEIRKIGQGSNQTNLNGALVAAIRLPLPSIEAQRWMVAPVEAFDARLKSDTSELQKLRTLRRGIVGNLLSRNLTNLAHM
ncbi:MAG: restriction endonuclease subunit S [Streptomyces sp.]|jgi:type I restriction enzyme, S subunit|uniref:restriction endonuclease subunit S n=1 Tax=Streptomyces sp. TaxID=1931 RepID=UPI0025E39AAE|nr:restriction endonuclease subunit S [Streptomyces sp.]MBW8799274.1 restriction endonuclease subunit S [Streptomyces sp.]